MILCYQMLPMLVARDQFRMRRGSTIVDQTVQPLVAMEGFCHQVLLPSFLAHVARGSLQRLPKAVNIPETSTKHHLIQRK